MNNKSIEEQLIVAKAHLKYLQNLPSNLFMPEIEYGVIYKHSIDVHMDAIKIAKAQVERLKVLGGQENTKKCMDEILKTKGDYDD